MIQRYSRPAMRAIWTDENKLKIWLQIELLASEALVAEGIVPRTDFERIKAGAEYFDGHPAELVERQKELEKTLNHDVIGFTSAVAERINHPASRWFHFGLTSSDVVDTAFAVQMVEKLGLRPAPIATQVVQRDIHAEFMNALALVGASIERWAVEFRHLQRTEVLEAEEPFTQGQKGSSAMPHKRNPITWERLTGLARVLRGNAVAALENVALWHERDISHSSVERIIFPDSCTLLDYMFGLLIRLIDGLQVYPENMKKNLRASLGLWNSQTVLLALIRKGLTRENAYELVQRNAMKTWEVKHAGRDDADFVEQLKSDPEVAKHFKPGELEKLCSLDFHFKEVQSRFKRLGL